MKIFFETDKELEIPGDSLNKINFDGMDLHRVILEEMDLTASSFVDANLRGSFLYRSNFTDCNFSNSNLIVADLREANLNFSNLKGILAYSCDLTNANLEGANLEGANLEEANLKGANLKSCLNISNAILEGATYDSKTTWPSSYDPKENGCIYVED